VLVAGQAVLVVVDMQVKLLPAIHERERVVRECRRLVEAAKLLAVPILWAEQNPRGLGATDPALAAVLPGSPLAKTTFSCLGDAEFRRRLSDLGRQQAILCGIEAHVCVAQTALDLLAQGYVVHVAADAVSSRTPENRQAGLDRVRSAGGVITSVEMCLFEMLGSAESPSFRDVLALVK
jgi:nicotinamidase-related amidase